MCIIYIYIYAHIYTCVYKYMYVYVQMFIKGDVCVWLYVDIVYVYTCMQMGLKHTDK